MDVLCVNCNLVVALTRHGRCERCGSDAVMAKRQDLKREADFSKGGNLRHKERKREYWPEAEVLTLPPLIITRWYEGYDYDELLEVLGPKFGEWMRGQTLAEHAMGGKLVSVAYRWDVERYLKGLPVID